MKRAPKQGTGLYAFLNSTGVLTNGTDEDITRSKKAYWTKYRKEWKKNKRQQSKAYIVLFSLKEARGIIQKAGELSLTPTKYIKQKALFESGHIGPVLIGKIREKLVLYGYDLESMLLKRDVSKAVTEEILIAVREMETSILSVLAPK